MIGDDHDIRDGWGSFAADSPTLAAKYPRGTKIFEKHNNFFLDAQDVYWHFQMAHNPAPSISINGDRFAMPYAFQCGRLLVLVTDARGERDLWRLQKPVFGESQWEFITNLVENIPSYIDAVAIITSVPIASMSPGNIGQRTVGKLEPDVRKFKRGDEKGIKLLLKQGGAIPELGKLEKIYSKVLGKTRKKIDDVRDQWAHPTSRLEQEKLIRLAGEIKTKNRLNGNPREIIFLGGEVHVGCIFEISVSNPSFKTTCMVSSGISQFADTKFLIGVVIDEDFEVALGIKSNLRDVVHSYNFGVIHFVPGGGATPRLIPAIIGKDGAKAGVIKIGKNALF